MPAKIFQRLFEGDFKGLDLKSTDLSIGPTSFKFLTNKEFGEGGSLVTRRGYQVIGQSRPGFTRIHTARYLDPVSGDIKEEFVGVNEFLWRLKLGYLTVTGGGAALNYYVAFNAATGTYRFYLRNAGTPYTLSGNTYLDLKTGMEEIADGANALVTIADLKDAISAAGLTCTLTPNKYAKIATGAEARSLTVTAATNTFAEGDWVSIMDTRATFPVFTARRIDSITAGPPDILNWTQRQFGRVTTKTGQVVGPAASAAAGIPAQNPTTAGTATLYIYFFYWDPIPMTSNFFGYRRSALGDPLFHGWTSPFDHQYKACRESSRSNWSHPHFLDTDNATYIYTKDYAPTYVPTYDGYPHKYDGQSTYREGLPRPKTPTVAVGGAGNVEAGVHRYLIQYEFRDSRGNINLSRTVESADATLAVNSVNTLTLWHPMIEYNARTAIISNNAVSTNPNVTAATNQIKVGDTVFILENAGGTPYYTTREVTNVNTAASPLANITLAATADTIQHVIGDTVYSVNENIGFNYKSAVVKGAQNDRDGSTNKLLVHNTVYYPCTLDIGDTFLIYDTRSSTYVERTVASMTFASATRDVTIGFTPITSQIDVADLQWISANFRVNIYRTKSGGNVFYRLRTITPQLRLATWAETDNVADANLLEQLIDVEIGKEQDPPPRASIACVHQGTRVASGIRAEPNTVYIYDSLNRESCPIASNSFDISSGATSGPITAMGNDSDDRLAVFRKEAYYDIAGDIEAQSFSIRPVREGDYGIPSHASLKKVRGILMGISLRGPIAIKGGDVMPDVGENIAPAIKNNFAIGAQWAIGFNNPKKGHYQVHIPSETYFGYYLHGHTDDLNYILDYDNKLAWLDRSYRNGYEPSGGIAIYADTIFHCSIHEPDDISGSQSFYSSVFREYEYNTDSPDWHVTPETVISHKLFGPLTSPSQMYVDNHLAISETIQWVVTLDEPAVDKEFIRLKIYSFYITQDQAYRTGATIDLTTYRNFQDTTPDSQTSFVIPATGNAELITKLLPGKARAMEFQITKDTLGENFQFSGYELIVGVSYNKEEFIK